VQRQGGFPHGGNPGWTILAAVSPRFGRGSPIRGVQKPSTKRALTKLVTIKWDGPPSTEMKLVALIHSWVLDGTGN